MMKLSPVVSDYISDFLKNSQLINSLVSGFGSPLNVVFPTQIHKNLQDFQRVYDKHGLMGKIFYAHKVNRSEALPREFATSAACIDVASKLELVSALAAGFKGERIEATGPKNEDFILLGLQHNIIFNVDNSQELRDIVMLKAKFCAETPKVKILLRASNFQRLPRISRFGTSYAQFDEIIDEAKKNAIYLDVLGVSFHLDSVEEKAKIFAISGSLSLIDKLRENGFSPRVLNIGGGFKANYVQSKAQWHDVLSKLKESILSGDKKLTWDGYQYGMSISDGALKGSPNIYSYYNNLSGADYLDAILSTALDAFENRTVAEFLADNMIDLYIEPGRAFLVQTGISLARVLFSKPLADGGDIVYLDAKANDLVEIDGFVDPVIVENSSPELLEEKGCYLVGSLCTETDMISRRRFFLGKKLEKGDVIAFINTSGYFMDFLATSSAMKYPAVKIAAYKNNSDWFFAADKIYFPQGENK